MGIDHLKVRLDFPTDVVLLGASVLGEDISVRWLDRPRHSEDKVFVLVPGGGVEPPRAEARRILSPLRIAVWI
jgi:hypothetical protein